MSSSEGSESDQKVTANPLGLLKDLPGSWEGTGLNFISLPTKAGSFFTITNRTRETFVFTDIGGPVTNRGSTGQNDVANFGVSYLQTVFDVKPNPDGGAPLENAIHVEPGFFLTCPPNNEQASETIVRLSSIPHGDTLMAQSIEAQIFTNQKPTFEIIPADSTHPFSMDLGALKPIVVGDPEKVLSGYNEGMRGAVARQVPTNIPGLVDIDLAHVLNPNQLLLDVVNEQPVPSEFVVFDLTTEQPIETSQIAQQAFSGGIINTPFIKKNADAVKATSKFWITNVQDTNGESFLQLQYTQTVLLRFPVSGVEIDWPHVSVATLRKRVDSAPAATTTGGIGLNFIRDPESVAIASVTRG